MTRSWVMRVVSMDSDGIFALMSTVEFNTKRTAHAIINTSTSRRNSFPELLFFFSSEVSSCFLTFVSSLMECMAPFG